MKSRPEPPESLSASEPPSSLSRPEPPNSLSLPCAPARRSLPLPPTMQSLPRPPLILSLPPSPKITSGRLEPVMRSDRLVPRTTNLTPLPLRQVLFLADFGASDGSATRPPLGPAYGRPTVVTVSRPLARLPSRSRVITHVLRAASYSAPVMHGLREPVKGPPVPSASADGTGVGVSRRGLVGRAVADLAAAGHAGLRHDDVLDDPAGRILHLEVHGALRERVAGAGLLVELDLHEPAGGEPLDRLLDGRDVDDLAIEADERHLARAAEARAGGRARGGRLGVRTMHHEG